METAGGQFTGHLVEFEVTRDCTGTRGLVGHGGKRPVVTAAGPPVARRRIKEHGMPGEIGVVDNGIDGLRGGSIGEEGFFRERDIVGDDIAGRGGARA